MRFPTPSHSVDSTPCWCWRRRGRRRRLRRVREPALPHLDNEGMPPKVIAVSLRGREQAVAGGLRGLLLASRGAQQFHQPNANLDTQIGLPAHLLFVRDEGCAEVLFSR